MTSCRSVGEHRVSSMSLRVSDSVRVRLFTDQPLYFVILRSRRPHCNHILQLMSTKIGMSSPCLIIYIAKTFIKACAARNWQGNSAVHQLRHEQGARGATNWETPE